MLLFLQLKGLLNTVNSICNYGAEELEEFEDVRRTLKPKPFFSPSFRKQEARLPNKFVNFGRWENRYKRAENFNPESRYYETHPSKEFEKRIPRKCFNCHSPNHLLYNCPEVKKESEPERPSNSEVQTYFVVPQRGLH
ncbi:hypothetical protein NPIL_172541 [Nephila pilipes]|uniref:CCHC-type domain-containing protein n=1 Tax=Nephila pilipes TaxID=299642 RepID=A0A8X6MWP6_NEPPI|nr:hypothetical protein NPIL_172541 [Nephila pilipes]